MTTNYPDNDETHSEPIKRANHPEPSEEIEAEEMTGSSGFRPEGLETEQVPADSRLYWEDEQPAGEDQAFAPASTSPGTEYSSVEPESSVEAPPEGEINALPMAMPAGQPPEESLPPLQPHLITRRPDRLTTVLFIAAVLLFIAAAVIYFLQPFTRLEPQTTASLLAGLGLALLLGLALRLLVVRNPRWQMESGCPQCGEHELLRISRHAGDRFLNLIGIPAYRYRCRSCTWEGARLSEHGRIVSPGATIPPTSHRSSPN